MNRQVLALMISAALPCAALAQDEGGTPSQLHPAWSPDSERIAYLELGTDGANVRIYDLASGEAISVAEGMRGRPNPAFSPDGGHLVYDTVTVDETTGEAIWEILIHDLATGSKQAFAAGAGRIMHPQWSPDGKQISFIRFDEIGTDIFMLDLATGKVRRVTETDGYQEFHPKWRSDGKALTYDRNREIEGGQRQHQLVELDLASGQARVLLSAIPGIVFGAPSYTSDGSSVLFSTLRGTDNGIWKLDLAGDSKGVLRRDGDGERTGGAKLSPDGKWLAFHAADEGAFSIYLAAPDGSQEQRIDG